MSGDSKAERQAQRQERLQAALRENLRRRKAQARARTKPDVQAQDASTERDAAGPSNQKPD